MIDRKEVETILNEHGDFSEESLKNASIELLSLVLKLRDTGLEDPIIDIIVHPLFKEEDFFKFSNKKRNNLFTENLDYFHTSKTGAKYLAANVSSLNEILRKSRYVELDLNGELELDVSSSVLGVKSFRENNGLGGDGVIIAVLDDEIADHPDLPPDRVYKKRSFSQLDFGQHNQFSQPAHATMVAGIIAGSGKLSGGRFVGIAPKATIWNYKIAPLKQFGINGNSTISGVVDAIVTAAEDGWSPYYQSILGQGDGISKCKI